MSLASEAHSRPFSALKIACESVSGQREMDRPLNLCEFFSGIWMQVRAGLFVGLPTNNSVGRHSTTAGWDHMTRDWTREHASKSPGRMTRNGLGSLEIGAARDRFDE